MGRRGPLPGAGKGADDKVTPSQPCPPPPSWLGPTARAEYERLAPNFDARDAAMLASYANAYGRLVRITEELAVEKVEVRGDRGAVVSPKIRAIEQAEASVFRAAQALGLTPGSRVRNGEPVAANNNPAAGPEDGMGPA